MTVELCNTYTDHIFKAAPAVVLLKGRPPEKFQIVFSRKTREIKVISISMESHDVQARANRLLPQD